MPEVYAWEPSTGSGQLLLCLRGKRVPSIHHNGFAVYPHTVQFRLPDADCRMKLRAGGERVGRAWHAKSENDGRDDRFQAEMVGMM